MEKLFVLVRNDIPIPYQGVQAGHALAQWLLENKDQTWNNNTLIYLQTNKLEQVIFKFDMENIKYSKFVEPDLDNKITAIAFQTEDKKVSKFKLVGM